LFFAIWNNAPKRKRFLFDRTGGGAEPKRFKGSPFPVQG
jgi:hypothetical protein